MYERLRRTDDPSAALLVGRYGWENACEKFGVPSGESWRPKASYTSRWTDEDIVKSVYEYVLHSRALREKPSYLGYDRWQQHDPDAPSGTLVRNRMRALGLRTWPAVVENAVASVVHVRLTTDTDAPLDPHGSGGFVMYPAFHDG